MICFRAVLILTSFYFYVIDFAEASCKGYGLNCTSPAFCCTVRGRLSCCIRNKTFVEQYWYVLVALIILLILIPCLLGICAYKRRQRHQSRSSISSSRARSNNNRSRGSRALNTVADAPPTYDEIIRSGIPPEFQHYSKQAYITSDLSPVCIETPEDEKEYPLELQVPPYSRD